MVAATQMYKNKIQTDSPGTQIQNIFLSWTQKNKNNTNKQWSKGIGFCEQ